MDIKYNNLFSNNNLKTFNKENIFRNNSFFLLHPSRVENYCSNWFWTLCERSMMNVRDSQNRAPAWNSMNSLRRPNVFTCQLQSFFDLPPPGQSRNNSPKLGLERVFGSLLQVFPFYLMFCMSVLWEIEFIIMKWDQKRFLDFMKRVRMRLKWGWSCVWIMNTRWWKMKRILRLHS